MSLLDTAVAALPYACAVVGGYYALGIVLEIYKRFLRPRASLRRFGANNGAWAVVTGASDGIGKSYSIELAKRGFNVLLISRTESKLNDVAENIHDKYKDVETRILAVDYANPVDEWFKRVEKAINDLGGPVGVLVNNVGISFSYPAKYMDSDHDWNNTMIDINIKAVNEMTWLCLPKMLERKAGAIINVSSISGQVPIPMLSTYSASKAYVKTFSACLATEYERDGIAVQVVTPNFVSTAMSKMRPGPLCCKPEVVTRGSLDTLGVEHHWCPFITHAIIEFVFMKVLPSGYLSNYLMKTNQSTRTRALRKIERQNSGK